MEKELSVQALLDAISSDEKYAGCVFWGPGIYFVIGNGRFWAIPDDAGSSPRGGWFPDIFAGPTSEESACVKKMMDELCFDEEFFNEVIEDYGEFDDEYVLEYFEDNDDEDSAKLYRKIKRKINSGKTPFDSIEAFVNAVRRYGLESDCLYYEWEGEFIDLHDNIAETGQQRGYYENLSDSEWIEILQDIDKHIVTPD